MPRKVYGEALAAEVGAHVERGTRAHSEQAVDRSGHTQLDELRPDARIDRHIRHERCVDHDVLRRHAVEIEHGVAPAALRDPDQDARARYSGHDPEDTFSGFEGVHGPLESACG
jgi:hypothetical protein